MTEATNKVIDAAALAVADALIALNEAGAALKPAIAHRDAIAGRIRALEAERAAILEARRSGDHDDAAQGARLLLIQADANELAAMHAEASAAVTPLLTAEAEARSHVSVAIAARDKMRDDEVLRITIERANELGELLLQAAIAIDTHKARLATSRNLWTPSRALAEKVHALYLQRTPEVNK